MQRNNIDYSKTLELAVQKFKNESEERDKKKILLSTLNPKKDANFKLLKNEKNHFKSKKKNFLSTTVRKKNRRDYQKNLLFQNRRLLNFPIDAEEKFDQIVLDIDREKSLNVFQLIHPAKKPLSAEKKLDFDFFYDTTLKNAHFLLGKVCVFSFFKLGAIKLQGNFNKTQNLMQKTKFFEKKFRSQPQVTFENPMKKFSFDALNLRKAPEDPQKNFVIFESYSLCNQVNIQEIISDFNHLKINLDLIKYSNKNLEGFPKENKKKNASFKTQRNLFVPMKSIDDQIKSLIDDYSSDSLKESKFDLAFCDTINSLCTLSVSKQKKNIALPKMSFNKSFPRITLNIPLKLNVKSSKDFLSLPALGQLPKKRSYNEMTKKENPQKTREKDDFFIINDSTIGTLISREGNFLRVKNLKEGLDFFFDFSVCGLVLTSSDFVDEYDFANYEELCQLINESYLQVSGFYFIIIDDEANKRNPNYSVKSVVKKIDDYLAKKFRETIRSGMFELKFFYRTIRCVGQLYQTIATIQNEIKGTYKFSLSQLNISDLNKILYQEITSKNMNTISKKFNKLNTFEGIVLTGLSSSKYFSAVEAIVKEKYKELNIIF